jgi:hypothetical protein
VDTTDEETSAQSRAEGEPADEPGSGGGAPPTAANVDAEGDGVVVPAQVVVKQNALEVLAEMGRRTAGEIDPVDISRLAQELIEARHLRRLQRQEMKLKQQTTDAELERLKQEQDDRLNRQKAEFEAREARWKAELAASEVARAADGRRVGRLDTYRSLVLMLVVLAVVLTPILAMCLKITPQSFLQYVAPITAITGTVLGYWFGHQESDGGAPQAKSRFVVTSDEQVVEVS